MKLCPLCGLLVPNGFHADDDPCPGPVVISRRHSDHAKTAKAEIRCLHLRSSETKETA